MKGESFEDNIHFEGAWGGVAAVAETKREPCYSFSGSQRRGDGFR